MLPAGEAAQLIGDLFKVDPTAAALRVRANPRVAGLGQAAAKGAEQQFGSGFDGLHAFGPGAEFIFVCHGIILTGRSCSYRAGFGLFRSGALGDGIYRGGRDS